MTTTSLTAPLRTACAGCLGRGTCWVCDGRGAVVDRVGEHRTCSRCSGRTLCTLCAPEPRG